MSAVQRAGLDLEELLDKAATACQAAEVYHVQHKEEPVHFEANRLKLVETRESSGVALRVVKDGRIGFSSTSDLSDVDGVVEHTLETAPFGPEASLEFPTRQDYAPVEVYDPGVASALPEDMVNIGQAAIDELRGYDPELVCDASVASRVTTVTILNSQGCYASYAKSGFSISVHGTIVKGDDMLFVSDSKSSCLRLTDISEIVHSIKEKLERSRKIAPAPMGQVPVLFTPKGVAGALLSPLLAGFGGRMVLQGASPLVGKLGQKLLDERFSLWDDPKYPYAPGSRLCDDEGMPTSKLPLVDKGVISSFLYDLQTAAMAGVDSTASAHRSLNSLPSPGPSVIMIQEGTVPFRDMIGGIEDGLLVENVLGAGQSNVMGGDFNANVLLGWRVVRGGIVGRVKNTIISGNVYKILKSIDAIGDETDWVGGSLKAPALYSEQVSVAAKDT